MHNPPLVNEFAVEFAHAIKTTPSVFCLER
jgi:hypothetical protein